MKRHTFITGKQFVSKTAGLNKKGYVYTEVQKMSPYYFLITQSERKRILIIFGIQNPEET